MGEIDWKTKFFHISPYPLKNALATIRGFQIEGYRRGSDFEQQVDETILRDFLSRSQWDEYQKDCLIPLLWHARKNVPFYRTYWNEHSEGSSRDTVEDLRNWPILNKEVVRSSPHLLLADTSDKKKLHVWHTSGSSGTPTKIYWAKGMMQKRWAIFEARSRRWYGVSYKDPFALIGGRMVTPYQRAKPPFWVWNAYSRQLYMSSYHLAPENIPSYLNEIKRRNVRHIYAYASSIYEIARYLLTVGGKPPKLKVIVTQAEPLYGYQRDAIENAFRSPVREGYGMAEMLLQASECENGKLHLWPEYGICEVEDDNGIVTTENEGNLVVTGLLNWDMPLIRYRVGDRVNLAAPSVNCTCGRGLSILENVVGRIDDVLLTKDGRKIGRLSTVFKNLPVVEVQTIQKSLDLVVLKVVPDTSYSKASENELIRSFRERMGDIGIHIELVEKIPRGQNGKFRTVICEIK